MRRRSPTRPEQTLGEANAAVPGEPRLGPLTEAGRFLAGFSPLQQMVRQQGTQPPPVPTSARDAEAARSWLAQAARHDAAGQLPAALAALRMAVRLAPDNATAHCNLGVSLIRSGQPQAAVASLQRAIRLQPRMGRAHFMLGVAQQDLGQEAAAIGAFRDAIALGANPREANARLGDLLSVIGDIPAAAECYRRAADGSSTGRLNAAKALMAEENYAEAATVVRRILALDPRNGEAEWVLGNLLVIQGRFAEAVPHFDRAIDLAPQAVGAYYSRVFARPVTAADRPLVTRMAALLDTAPLSDVARMKLHYALGKALDDLGDYAAAIRHFDAANRIEKGLAGYDRARQAAWVDTLIARFTPDYFARHAGLGVDDETPVFILGMPRSGTTLVEQIVSSHPAVAGAGELHFWPRRGPEWERRGPDGLTAPVTQALADDYRAELRRIAPETARVTDKMPHNYLWIGLIHLVFPRARIIHCRRHPVDTCLSIYFTQFLTRMNFANDRGDLAWEYRQYERLMAHWRHVLPDDRFLDVDYESLVTDREAGTRRLIAFCGLDWDAACLHPESNQRVVRTASLWQARQPVYRSSMQRWRNYAPWLGELRTLLPPSD